MRQSMTGYAAGQGSHDGLSWVWDLRSVNGKGLDLRLRLPEGIPGLEAGLRAALTAAVARGNVTVALRLQGGAEDGALRLSEPQLARVLDALTRIEAEAMEIGLSLAPATAAQIAGLRGVLDSGGAEADLSELCPVLLADFEPVLASFLKMRGTEGAALETVLNDQLDEIATLTENAAAQAQEREAEQAKRLRGQLAAVMDNAAGADPQRLAQELALIAVKSDVTEEIDRLRAHVAAARGLLSAEGAVGRKLDFLMQEFNREANTLCSKAGYPPLTTTGLALKTVIDRMREQVQNLE